MSGFLGTALVAGIEATSITLSNGSPVILGEFVFYGFEVPETISWGGAQQVNIHKLPGGKRVIDVMGQDDADLTWSGILLSPDASQRADDLNEMRAGGVQRELLFMGRSYTVVIRDVRFTHHKVNHVDYSITCTVLQDNSQDQQSQDDDDVAAINDDANAAAALTAAYTGLNTAQVILGTIPPMMAGTTALVAGSAMAVGVLTGLTAAQASIMTVESVASGQVAGIAAAAATTGVVLGAADAVSAANNLALAATSTAALATAVSMNAYVGRAIANVPT